MCVLNHGQCLSDITSPSSKKSKKNEIESSELSA